MLKLRIYPDPVLNRKAKPVLRIDSETRKLVAEMFEAMYANRGVGLAAPQIGESVKLCVINCVGEKDKGGELVLINPVLVESIGEDTDEEGCLSVPGIRSNVTRASKVKVSGYDIDGNEIEIEAEGLLARALQHEIDHLNGRLFVQRLNDAAKMSIKPHLKILEEQSEEEA